MYLFNISFHLNEEIETEIAIFIKNVIKPKVEESGFFQNPLITRVLMINEPENVSMGIQMTADNMTESLCWLENELSPLIDKKQQEMVGKLLSFIVPMQIL